MFCCVCNGSCWHIGPHMYCREHDPNVCDRHRPRRPCPRCAEDERHMRELQDAETRRREAIA